jgi:NTP pyrophosphatase (non-canonical NTP hydrolase)
MASVKRNTTIREYQGFVKEVYGLTNDRYFSLWDMITNMERFIMRGLKGIRKKDWEKIRINLLIAQSWFMSIANQLHIDIENAVWKRFPYLCSYCGSCPCSCKEKKLKRRVKVPINNKKRPKTLEEFQLMFKKIYPPETRTLEHSGVHLIEEAGEFSEALLTYRGRHEDKDFENIEIEAADLYSCLIGVFNSLDINVAKEVSAMFTKNCHVCKNAPCTCNFKDITSFES